MLTLYRVWPGCARHVGGLGQHQASATIGSNRQLGGGAVSVVFKKPWRFAATRRNEATKKKSVTAVHDYDDKLPKEQSVLRKARTYFENNPSTH